MSAVTLLLLPILQATQDRDSSGLPAKLCELIEIHCDAKDTLLGLERRSADESRRSARPRGVTWMKGCERLSCSGESIQAGAVDHLDAGSPRSNELLSF